MAECRSDGLLWEVAVRVFEPAKKERWVCGRAAERCAFSGLMLGIWGVGSCQLPGAAKMPQLRKIPEITVRSPI